jgi:hypothetical protein
MRVHVPYMSDSDREELKREQMLAGLLKNMRECQDLIHIKLGIALRGGLTRDLRDQIEDAAQSYGEAFSRIMAACHEQQRVITSR